MLSIVIPTFNEEKYLPKLLESLKKQTFQQYEIIVADNNSKDNTRQLAKKYGCNVIGGGLPGIARNKGANTANYDLLFLDADIILDDSFLHNLLDKIYLKKLDIASCKLIPITDKLTYKLYYIVKNYGNKYFSFFKPHISGQCLFIKSSLFRKIKGYDESLLLGEEHDLLDRAIKEGAKYEFLNLGVKVSPRRIKKEGFLILFWKASYSELYRTFGGKIRKPIISYEFGNYNERNI